MSESPNGFGFFELYRAAGLSGRAASQCEATPPPHPPQVLPREPWHATPPSLRNDSIIFVCRLAIQMGDANDILLKESRNKVFLTSRRKKSCADEQSIAWA
jgi:hypothetical protein